MLAPAAERGRSGDNARISSCKDPEPHVALIDPYPGGPGDQMTDGGSKSPCILPDNDHNLDK